MGYKDMIVQLLMCLGIGSVLLYNVVFYMYNNKSEYCFGNYASLASLATQFCTK